MLDDHICLPILQSIVLLLFLVYAIQGDSYCPDVARNMDIFKSGITLIGKKFFFFIKENVKIICKETVETSSWASFNLKDSPLHYTPPTAAIYTKALLGGGIWVYQINYRTVPLIRKFCVLPLRCTYASWG